VRLHRIWLWVADENRAAMRVYEKAGFIDYLDCCQITGSWPACARGLED
jgi:hypothetical protein